MISVIIPAYNEENYIGQCLDSLSKQKLKDFEIILVDNNSTDKTVKIAINKAKENSLKLKIVTEKQKGIIPARLAGFEQANNYFLASSDADTVINENWLQEISKKLRINDILAGDAFFPKEFWKTVPDLGYWFRETKKHLFKINDLFPSMTNGANFALTKKCLGQIRSRLLKNKDDRIFGFNATLMGFKLDRLETINLASPRRFVFEFFTFVEKGTYKIKESDYRNEGVLYKKQCEIINEAAKSKKLKDSDFEKNYIKEYLFPAVITNPRLFRKRQSFFNDIDIKKYIGLKKYFSNLDEILNTSELLTEKYFKKIITKIKNI